MADKELKQIIQQLHATKPATLAQAPQLLSRAKLALLHLNALLPTETSSADHLALARETLELGAFLSIRLRDTDAPVLAAARALEACGYAARPIPTGGASDANALIAAGLPTVNLANGTQRNHQPDECVPVAALEGMLDVAFALLDAAAEVPA